MHAAASRPERPSILGRWTFLWVAFMLVALYVVSEVYGQTRPGGVVTLVMAYSVVLVTFHRVGVAIRWLRLTLASGLVVTPLAVIWAVTGVSGLRSPGDIAASVLAVAGLVVLLRFILTAHRVTLDVVFASVCTYLIVGLVFGIVFTQIAFYAPEAFVPAQPVRIAGESSLFYFSFTVLTTLGFGDIAPSSDAVRALTVLEAVIGQVFLIVLVARLVGVQIAQRRL